MKLKLKKSFERTSVRLCVLILAVTLVSCEIVGPLHDGQLRVNSRSYQTRSAIGEILFVSYYRSRATGHMSLPCLYSMNEDGANVKQICDTSFPVSDARWSKDGSKIILTSPVGGIRLYGDAIYIMDAISKSIEKITYQESGLTRTIIGVNPVLSPNAKQVVFASIAGHEAFGNYDLFIANIDGSDVRQLTFTGNVTERVSDWSPDRQILAGDLFDYSLRDSIGRYIENTRLAYFDLSGSIVSTWGTPGNVFYHPIYSRAGDRIAFISSKGGNYQGIYRMRVGGSDDTLLVGDQYRFNYPVAWSPDDRQLLYNAGPNDTRRILIIGIHTKIVCDITPFDNDTTYSRAVSWR